MSSRHLTTSRTNIINNFTNTDSYQLRPKIDLRDYNPVHNHKILGYTKFSQFADRDKTSYIAKISSQLDE